MKSSVILATACATVALATPAIKTEVVYDYVTVTVTGTGPSPTAAPPAAETPEAPTGDAGAFFSQNTENHNEGTSAPAPAPAPAPAAAPVDTSNLSSYAAPIIEAHNKARAQHSAPPIEWDDNLASIAQLIGQTCIYAHNTEMGGGGYGQNIAAGAAPNAINDVIFKSMYQDEISNYHAYGGEPDIGSLGKWGHATQIVWKGSTKVGCASVTCGSLANSPGTSPVFTVCNYSPAGNVIGRFADNVLPN